MAEEIRLWRSSEGEHLSELPRARLDLEERLEGWLANDISILDRGLLVIGRQVETDYGGLIDLLCVDGVGDLVIVELKRDKTPREITAQALDYGSWVKDLSHERITALGTSYLGDGEFESAFSRRFGTELPETLGEGHKMLIVGSEIDPSSERIITYLSGTYGVNINAATFQYFKDADGSEFLARVFLLEPSQVQMQSRSGASKRKPNLTYEELHAIAAERGVADLYDLAFDGLARFLKRHTTQSSVAFTAPFHGGQRALVSLIPAKSGRSQGLHFEVYVLRLQTLLSRSESDVLEILPQKREPWSYGEDLGPEWEGYSGFFANEAEISRFVSAFAELPDSGLGT